MRELTADEAFYVSGGTEENEGNWLSRLVKKLRELFGDNDQEDIEFDIQYEGSAESGPVGGVSVTVTGTVAPVNVTTYLDLGLIQIPLVTVNVSGTGNGGGTDPGTGPGENAPQMPTIEP